jgi:hypothetical protein
MDEIPRVCVPRGGIAASATLTGRLPAADTCAYPVPKRPTVLPEYLDFLCYNRVLSKFCQS